MCEGGTRREFGCNRLADLVGLDAAKTGEAICGFVPQHLVSQLDYVADSARSHLVGPSDQGVLSVNHKSKPVPSEP